MTSLAQLGITGLGRFRDMFKERYDLLGLTDKMPGLR